MGHESDDEMELDIDVQKAAENIPITESTIEEARKHLETERERQYADRAIRIAENAGIFTNRNVVDSNALNGVSQTPIARNAEKDELQALILWDKELKKATRSQHESQGVINLTNIAEEITITAKNRVLFPTVQPTTSSGPSQERPLLAKLNHEQKRAHDIIESCLKGKLSGTFHFDDTEKTN